MVQGQEAMLRIGAVARRSGVSVDTVRYYEKRGLVPPAARLASGYRCYPESTVARIVLARRLAGLGMTLDEIAGALRSHDGPGDPCPSQRWRLEAVRERIERRVAELTAVHAEVDAVLARCERGDCVLRDGA